jgi:hypothetical protein
MRDPSAERPVNGRASSHTVDSRRVRCRRIRCRRCEAFRDSEVRLMRTDELD